MEPSARLRLWQPRAEGGLPYSGRGSAGRAKDGLRAGLTVPKAELRPTSHKVLRLWVHHNQYYYLV